MTFHSGKGGTATFTPAGGGTSVVELPITNWSVDPKTEMVNFRNSKTGNYSKKEATFKDCDFTIGLDYDFDGSVFAAPISLNEGDVLTGVHLYLGPTGTTSTSFWLFPSAIVLGTPQTLEVDGKIGTTINCTADGTWTPPTV
jgi:hypothetical protein